jgi:hypothetical protein
MMMRSIRSFLVVAGVSLGAAVAFAAPGGGSGAGSGAGGAGSGAGDGMKWKPPQAAFDACAKSKEGDACSFKGQAGRQRSGKCEMPKAKALAGKGLICRVQRGGGNGGGGGGGNGGGGGTGSAAKPGTGSGAKH